MQFTANALGLLLAALSLLPSGFSTSPLTTTPLLIVTGFGFYESFDVRIPSHVTFKVMDSRPEYFIETNCTLFSPPNSNNIYTDDWTSCDTTELVTFWMTEDFMQLKREWLVDPQRDDTSTVIGMTDKQNPYWADMGWPTCGNVTGTISGRFKQAYVWDFPITTIVA